MVKKRLMFFVSLLFIVSVCFGQTTTTGALNGTVTDPDDVALPGITVVITSPALVLPQQTTVTNASGVYRFPNLPPGTYEITFSLEGMNTLVRKGIVVSLGKTSTVDTGMTLKSVEERIVVEGKAPTIDRQTTVGSANLDLEFLKSLPTTRDLDDYFNMTPGVTGNTAFGSAEIGNSYNLDGVNLGDAATGTRGVSFGIDIMEEFSVQTGGLPAEYGGVQGAVVNVVTKSGGNRFSGAASFYYDHESLQSDNSGGTPLEENKVGAKVRYEPVITLGGPIIKNKLWFFGNYSITVEEEYVSGYPWDVIEAGGSEIAPKITQPYPYFKLTFAPSDKDKFIASWNHYDNKNSDRFASKYESEDSTSLQTNPTDVFNLHWTHLFSSDFYVNVKAAMIRRTFKIDAKVDEPYYVEQTTNRRYGGSWRNHDDYGRDRNQITVDCTTFVDNVAGSHEIKFGGEFQQFHSGWYVKGIPDPVTGACYVGLWNGDYSWGLQLIGDVDRKETIQNIHFYLQDTWSITKNLTFNLGLRYENNAMYYPKQGTGVDETYDFITVNRSVDKRTKSYAWTNIVPRVGAIYDLFSDGSTLLKASYSRMLIPNQLGFVNLAHPNGWFGVIEFYYPNGDLGGWQPWSIPGATAQVGHPNYDLKASYTDEFVIGMERELWEDWSVGLRYIKKWDKDLIHVVDAAQLDFNALMETGDLVWTNWSPVTTTDPYNGQEATFYNQIDTTLTEGYIVNPPGAEREFDGVELTLRKRYSHGWQLMASYTWSHSRGLIDTDRGSESLGTSGLYADPNWHINNYGRFHLERRHMFKLQGLVKGPWGINISGYFRGLSGRRETRAIRSGDLGVGLNQGTTTIFAEERGSWGYPFLVTLDMRLEKAFKIGNFTLAAFVDCFNVFNNNKTTEVYMTSSNPNIPFEDVETIQDPRIFRLGARIEFQ